MLPPQVDKLLSVAPRVKKSLVSGGPWGSKEFPHPTSPHPTLDSKHNLPAEEQGENLWTKTMKSGPRKQLLSDTTCKIRK